MRSAMCVCAAATLFSSLTACGDDARTTAARSGCASPRTVEIQGGNVVSVETLAEFGHLGASVLVVEVSDEQPITALDEDPAQGATFPNVFTRYDMAVEQILVWPDSAPAPAVGDQLTLDVVGGTIGCFTLAVDPPPATLEPGGMYLIAAEIRDGEHMLWNGIYAMKVTDGLIRDPGVMLPTALKNLIGHPTSALPPFTSVE